MAKTVISTEKERYMQYVNSGKTGAKVSRLGMGCMRLPSYEKDGKTLLDEEKRPKRL
jgi:predicted aldo/keto reductase-like oxidoreductase